MGAGTHTGPGAGSGCLPVPGSRRDSNEQEPPSPAFWTRPPVCLTVMMPVTVTLWESALPVSNQSADSTFLIF